MKKYIVTFLSLWFFSLTALAAVNPIQEVQKVGQKCAVTLTSQDPEKMANLYDKNAFLYATFENQIDTREGIINYFKKLMTKKDLNVHFQKQNIRVYNDAAINSGSYTFSFTQDGKTITVPARYTFVYALEPRGGWTIIDHHSSILPEEKAS